MGRPVKKVHKSIAEGTFTQEEFSGQLYKILLKLKTLVEKNTKKSYNFLVEIM